MKYWNGIVLQAQPLPPDTKDRENNKLYTDERSLRITSFLLLAAISLFIGSSIITSGLLINNLLMITAFTGAMVRYLMVVKDLGISTLSTFHLWIILA